MNKNSLHFDRNLCENYFNLIFSQCKNSLSLPLMSAEIVEFAMDNVGVIVELDLQSDDGGKQIHRV